MPRAGWRSRPKTCWLGMSETTAVPGVGLLRSPARGKPARHHKRAGRKKSTVQENCCAAAAPKLPTCRRPPSGERACPALGGEAAPKPAGSVCLKQLRCLGWGCSAAQRGASPLATTSALAARNLQSKKTAALQPPKLPTCRRPPSGERARRKKSAVQENCCAAALPKLPTCRRPPSGERACPALGGEAAPKPAGSVCLKQLRCLGWGCYAAQRGASPLATTSALAARNLQSKKTAALQPPPNSRPAAALPVASGLAPRWVAKPPQNLLARYV
ncbi:hypothetical protein SAMN04490200_5113 [Pseudomonas proteolytica]|nr:hypothetical protein SAMN04490200_5113 [Pseudomonas proteolytica]